MCVSVKYPEFKGCVDSQRPACEGNIMFQMLDEAFNQLTMACTGGGNPGKECSDTSNKVNFSGITEKWFF